MPAGIRGAKKQKQILTTEFLTAVITINIALTFVIPIFFATTFSSVVTVGQSSKVPELRTEMRNMLASFLFVSLSALALITCKEKINETKALSIIIILIILILTIWNAYRGWKLIYDSSVITFNLTTSETIKISESGTYCVYRVNGTKECGALIP